MLPPEMYLQLAHQRRAEEAEAARQWRLARAGRSGPDRARPPVEGARLLAFLTGPPAQTVCRRFFTLRVRWSERDLDRVLPSDEGRKAEILVHQDGR
jgi:hypothetical protein